jgi:hypothetical protein
MRDLRLVVIGLSERLSSQSTRRNHLNARIGDLLHPADIQFYTKICIAF